MVPQKKKLTKTGLAKAVFVFNGGFRFKECVEYQILWKSAGVEKYVFLYYQNHTGFHIV